MSEICWTLVPTSTALYWWRQYVPLRTNGYVHAWHLECQMLLGYNVRLDKLDGQRTDFLGRETGLFALRRCASRWCTRTSRGTSHCS
jgi:hypothetical protein